MSIIKAEMNNLSVVKDITVKTITQIYPHYYPKGAVEFFVEHHNEENIVKDIQLDRVFLCVDELENVVGTVTIKDNEICRLFVLPEYQGQGYGRELLDYAEHRISQVHNQIILDASLPAKGIYRKRGYVETETNHIKTNYEDYLCYDVMVKVAIR